MNTSQSFKDFIISELLSGVNRDYLLVQDEFILRENLKRIHSFQQKMDNRLQMSYKEHRYISSGDDRFESARDSCPAHSWARRAALSGTDAGTSLSGFFG